ncbi:MAG: hypothetical protein JO045_08960 [Mycobacterium sp.]|nr:hypothetical protein [Mycobacterium sp.]
MSVIDETICRVEANGDAVHLPELLRVKGSILIAMSQSEVGDAEMCFMQSLELSCRQGARAWELRAALDLAVLLISHGRQEQAGALLQPIFDGFRDGAVTSDLLAAERLLNDLGLSKPGPIDSRGGKKSDRSRGPNRMHTPSKC